MTGKLILLVEDDPDVSDTLRSLLIAFGYRVEVASDGQKGLRVLREGVRPSIILLDLMMPNMDGHRFRDVLREDLELNAIPTIVLTADMRASAEKLGVTACFRKPFDPAELLAAIKQHC